jgi:hypothetical protein
MALYITGQEMTIGLKGVSRGFLSQGLRIRSNSCSMQAPFDLCCVMKFFYLLIHSAFTITHNIKRERT